MADRSVSERKSQALEDLMVRLRTQYNLSEEDIGCTMLIVQAIGKFNLDPENAGKFIADSLRDGAKTFTYAKNTFTVTRDDFKNFSPNEAVFLDCYKTFHMVHDQMETNRMVVRTDKDKSSEANALVESILSYSGLRN